MRSVEAYSARASGTFSTTATLCSSAVRTILAASSSCPFASTMGAGVPIRLVAQSHREMGGVPDHHVRLWHLLHHSGLSHFPLGLLDLSLDFRISLCLLELLLDLLFGHPDLPLIVPPLIKDICRSQHREGRPDLHGQQEALLKQMGTGRQKIGVKIFGKQDPARWC